MKCLFALKFRLLFVFVGMFLVQSLGADWLWGGVPFGSLPNMLLSLFSASGVTLVLTLLWCKGRLIE